MQTIILSRTRMGSHRCIGGIIVDNANGHRSVRLLNPATISANQCVEGEQKGSWPTSAPYQIGEVWDLDLEPPSRTDPPHVEDVIVRGGRKTHEGTPQQVVTWLRRFAPGMQPPFWWEGDLKAVFDGRLRSSRPSSGHGTGYVVREALPATSTGFWVPDGDLVWDGEKKYEYHPPEGSPFALAPSVSQIAYVGEPDPVGTITAGTVVRLSLARWHTLGHYPEACWLQLSGWY